MANGWKACALIKKILKSHINQNKKVLLNIKKVDYKRIFNEKINFLFSRGFNSRPSLMFMFENLNN